MSFGTEEHVFFVGEGEAGERLDRFLAAKLEGVSRSRIQGLIREGRVLCNGRVCKASEGVRVGERVVVRLPPVQKLEGIEPQKIDLDILYEDEHLIVLNKPAGLVVHPGAGAGEGTLVHGLLHYCRDLRGIGGVERPGIVHRLDKETSGCLVVAKTERAHHWLTREFAARRVGKVYLAVVDGLVREEEGRVAVPIVRHPVHRHKMAAMEREGARAAETFWRRLVVGEGMSLLECRPVTGRTHQIRVHLKHMGHPVIGDGVYGRRGGWNRHLLHAWKLRFRHPVTEKEIEFCAPVPREFPLLPVEGGSGTISG